jgi:hypothetical protein
MCFPKELLLLHSLQWKESFKLSSKQWMCGAGVEQLQLHGHSKGEAALGWTSTAEMWIPKALLQKHN